MTESQRERGGAEKHREEGADQLRFGFAARAKDRRVCRNRRPKYQLEVTMTLIKSILLGSAAAIVAVASAQAADLPTKKAAPIAQMSRSATSAASPAGPCRAPTPA